MLVVQAIKEFRFQVGKRERKEKMVEKMYDPAKVIQEMTSVSTASGLSCKLQVSITVKIPRLLYFTKVDDESTQDRRDDKGQDCDDSAVDKEIKLQPTTAGWSNYRPKNEFKEVRITCYHGDNGTYVFDNAGSDNTPVSLAYYDPPFGLDKKLVYDSVAASVNDVSTLHLLLFRFY